MGMCGTDILSDLQDIRENPKRILIYSDFDSARQQASNDVYFSLVMLTTGKAATIVRTVRDNNGYEAYRFLENYGKHVTSLTQILKLDFGSNPSEFLDKLIEWEGLTDKYEQETLETISKNLLCAIVVEKAPETIRMSGGDNTQGLPNGLECLSKSLNPCTSGNKISRTSLNCASYE